METFNIITVKISVNIINDFFKTCTQTGNQWRIRVFCIQYIFTNTNAIRVYRSIVCSLYR